MSAPQDTLSTPAEKPTAYRSPGSVLGGGIILALVLAAVVDLLVTAPRHWLGIAVLVAVGVLAFFFGLYPAAFADRRRFVIRNPFRTIVLHWPRVDRITVRLSFDVFTTDEPPAKYTAWAIPVSLRDRRKADRARWREAANRERDARRGRQTSDPFGGTPVPRHDPQAPLADQAYTEIEERRAACQDHLDDVPPVTVTWTWQTFVACGVAALLIVLAAVLG